MTPPSVASWGHPKISYHYVVLRFHGIHLDSTYKHLQTHKNDLSKIFRNLNIRLHIIILPRKGQ